MPLILLNGDPGTTWTNTTGRIKFQFVAMLANTCGVCLSYHMAVGGPWPIPLHRGCRCYQVPLAPGAESQPFVDFQQILAEMPHNQQVAAVGANNYKLIESGTVKFTDVVTPTRVRTNREVIAREGLGVKALRDAGLSKGYIERVLATINAPAAQIAREHSRKLVEAITQTVGSREKAIRAIAEHIASKVSVAPVPPPAVIPKIPAEDVPQFIEIAEEQIAEARAAIQPTPPEKPPLKKAAPAAVGLNAAIQETQNAPSRTDQLDPRD